MAFPKYSLHGEWVSFAVRTKHLMISKNSPNFSFFGQKHSWEWALCGVNGQLYAMEQMRASSPAYLCLVPCKWWARRSVSWAHGGQQSRTECSRRGVRRHGERRPRVKRSTGCSPPNTGRTQVSKAEPPGGDGSVRLSFDGAEYLWSHT